MMEKDMIEMFQLIVKKVDSLGNEIRAVKENQQKTDEELRNIKLTLENETNKKINLMYESHKSIVKKLEKVDEIDSIKEQLADIQRAVIVHTAQIAELKKA